jgi:DNA-3-methyladenine glycosylase
LWIGDDGAPVGAVGESVRIGLTKGAEARLRYFVEDSAYLSGTRTLNGSKIGRRARTPR